MRWFKELQSPALKCERIGHLEGTRERKGYRKPEFGDWGCVARSVTEQRRECRRCRHALAEWSIVSDRHIHSLSMPSDRMDRFDASGELWQHENWATTQDDAMMEARN